MYDPTIVHSLILAVLGATGLAFSDYHKAPERWDTRPKSRFRLHWALTVLCFVMFWLNSMSNKLVWRD